MKFHIETLGCKMNRVDSERIQEKLLESGWMHDAEAADIFIVNTCTVTDNADKKSRSKTKGARDTATLVITGCSARTSGDKWKEKFPNCILCPAPKDVVEYCLSISPTSETPQIFLNSLPGAVRAQEPDKKTRKYIEIQSGCDTYCSYCIIPFA